MKILRDYQEECAACINRSLATHSSTMAVLATGLGKSVIVARVGVDWKRSNVLYLAHRIELVDQMAEQLGAELGYMPIIEQATRGGDPDVFWEGGCIIVGAIQSMISPKRLRKFKDHPFGLVVIDECHRATSPSYLKFMEHARELDPQCRALGVTATPSRTDGTAMGLVFEDCAFEMGIVPGIDAGWLVDVHQKFGLLSEVDFSQFKLRRNEFGELDFKQDELERILMEEKSLHEMTRPVLDLTEDGRQAIIFAASVPHAHIWAMVLNRYRDGCAAAIDGTTDKEERKPKVADFKAGRLQFLVNYGVFTEGFDAPSTSVIVMGRPTKSLLVYTQMLGRGTRPLPGVVDGIATAEGRRDAIAASAKPFVTVLDFVGNSRHKIVAATDVLGGNYDVDIREVANKRLTQETGNVREAIRKARAAMILAADERRRLGLIVDHVDYQLQDVDVFGPAGAQTIRPSHVRGGSTDGQIGLLVNLGVPHETASAYSRRQAAAVITNLREKRCTLRQGGILEKYGYDPSDFNMNSASEMIEAIKRNGWKAP